MKKNINNRGFTLIELLAVMIILITVSLVAVGGISESLMRRDVKECKEQQELAISAAKMYFSLDGKGKKEVTILTLKSGGYFSDNMILDRLQDGDIVKFTDSGYLYQGESCS